MKGATLKIELREQKGGGKVKSLRRDGYIPSVIYGKGVEPISTKIKVSDFRNGLREFGKNAVFYVNPDGGTPYPIVIKDIQYDILKDDYLHIDFQKISLTEKRRVDIPVRITGRGVVEATGNLINQLLDMVEVECLPQDTPEAVEVDVSGMAVGDTLTAGQIQLPENVSLLTNPEEAIIKVNEPKGSVADTEEDSEETENAEDTEATTE